MTNLKQNELQEIVNLFESELSMLKKVSRIEKMKIRKRVAAAILPALAISNLNMDIFMSIMEDRLSDVFDLFLDGWGFRQKLYQTVNPIFFRLSANKSRLRELVKS